MLIQIDFMIINTQIKASVLYWLKIVCRLLKIEPIKIQKIDFIAFCSELF